MKKYYWAKGDVKTKLLHFARPSETGCWEWQGPKNVYGYGRICFDSTSKMAHRVSYEIFRGKIDKGLFVCHDCDNPSCVNPDHLFLGDQKKNMADCRDKKRHNYGTRNGGAKLNDDVVRKILQIGSLGAKTHLEISQQFGVSRSAIGAILSRKRWPHITATEG